jgi:molecular chaperone DnaK (HSP70)
MTEQATATNGAGKDGIELIKMRHVVGIDLGTTNSSISLFQRNVPQTIPLSPAVAGLGGRSMPSAVRFTNHKRDGVVVGRKAREQALIHPGEVVTSIKSVMRRSDWRDDPEVVERLTVEGTLVEPFEIAAMILRELLEQAYAQEVIELDGEVRHAVICVPANSTDEYRRAVHRAAALAGIGEKDEAGQVRVDADGRAAGVYLLEEPIAAAFEYGRQVGVFAGQKQQKILVYDLGGGTFDVTVLDLDSSGSRPRFSVLSTSGVARLGGDDFDRVMMEMAAERFNESTGIDLFNLNLPSGSALTQKALKTAQQQLKAAAEEAKIALGSGSARASILLPALLNDGEGNVHNLDVEIAKADYVARIQPLLEQAQQSVRDALAEAGLGLDDINRVVMVGGSTKADWVRESIRALYPAGEERDPFVAADVDLIVSQGAAYYGESLRRPGMVQVDKIVQHHLGVELVGEWFGLVLPKGLPLDTETPVQHRTRVFANPDDADTLVISVFKTQKHLEVAEENGEFVTPDRHHVREKTELGGEVFEHCGEFFLRGVPRGPAGKYPVVVDMEIDGENLLRVKARCEGIEGDTELKLARV